MYANGFIEKLFKLKAKLLNENHAKRKLDGKRKREEMSKKDRKRHVCWAIALIRIFTHLSLCSLFLRMCVTAADDGYVVATATVFIV